MTKLMTGLYQVIDRSLAGDFGFNKVVESRVWLCYACGEQDLNVYGTQPKAAVRLRHSAKDRKPCAHCPKH